VRVFVSLPLSPVFFVHDFFCHLLTSTSYQKNI
jgi:hypothetical protein